MARKLRELFEICDLKLNTKTKNMAIGDTSRDLKLEDGKGKISHVIEYVFWGIRITKD